MKKITLFISFLCVVLFASAQSTIRLTFDDNTLNGASVFYSGSVSVIANPVTTGANSSAYCLDVVNNGYAPVKIANFAIPAGTAASYPYWKLRIKVAYKGYNGGTDLDYPSIDLYSQTTGSFLESDKLGSFSSVWSSHTAANDSMQWKIAEFTMSASTLASIPAGNLVLKLAKPKCEYLLDEIELIPSLTYGSDFMTITDFESATLTDATTYPMTNIYGSAAAGTSVVVADPANSAAKALSVSPTSYNNTAAFSVSLPSGKYMNSYDFLYFDRNSAATQYAQLYVKYGSTVLYKDNTSQYPTQIAAWNTRVFGIPSSVSSTTSSFTILIGYTNMNSGTYYLDNVKLHAIPTTPNPGTGFENADITPMVIYCNGNSFVMNQMADQVEVFSMSGHKLATVNKTNSISVANLSSGLYIVKSIVNGETFINKVQK